MLDEPSNITYVKDIKMHYNTNLTRLKWKGKSIPQMLEPFQPSIQASLDGTHETLEYTRDGAKWEDVESNWKEYHKYLNKGKQMGVATVLSAPVLFDIDRYLEFYGEYDPFLHPHYFYVKLDHIDTNPGLLDLRRYPKDIFYSTINNVKQKMKSSGLRGSKKWDQILTAYEKEYEDLDNSEYVISKLKLKQTHREKFCVTNRTLSDVYRITNPQAAEWLDNIRTDIIKTRDIT